MGAHLHLSALSTTPNQHPQPPYEAPIAVVAAGSAPTNARARSAVRHAAASRDDFDGVDSGSSSEDGEVASDAGSGGGGGRERRATAASRRRATRDSRCSGPTTVASSSAVGASAAAAPGPAHARAPRGAAPFARVLFPTVYDERGPRLPRLAKPSAAARRGAAVFLQELATQLATAHVSCGQLEHLLRLLPAHVPGLRVEVLVLLFERIADLWCIERVLWALSMPERRAAVVRLGWLNLWDPMAPDGKYTLDLSSHEERSVATMLVHLAMKEPGQNFVGAEQQRPPQQRRRACCTALTYIHTRRCRARADAQYIIQKLPVPGWTLPASWARGLPKRGTLSVTYSSLGEGFQADWNARRALRDLTLLYSSS